MNESTPWTPSVITRALDKVLGTLLVANKPEVISYGANSEALWKSLDPESLASVPPCLRGEPSPGLILVWDGTATLSSLAGRNTSDYINPLTWALCAVKRHPSLRIAVLDVDPAKHAKGRFYQVVQAIDSTKRPFGLFSEPCQCVADVVRFLKRENKGGRSHAEAQRRKGENEEKIALAKAQRREEEKDAVTKLLTHQVKAMLTERGDQSDHHALANIVGPLILMGNQTHAKTQSSEGDSARHSLYTLFREIGLIGAVKERNRTSREGAETQSILKGVGTDSRIRLLLVDDQWADGWGQWVENMLVEHEPWHLERMNTPDAVVSVLEEAFLEESLVSGTRFRLAFPAGQNNDGEMASLQDAAADTVLLLDLRLFSADPVGNEADFVKTRLLPLCQLFPKPGTGNKSEFAWPGFTVQEMADVTSWCAAPVRETDVYLLVLSLLPRLLALADFSLPIVLFSSTGQRRIAELLKPYGNIITDFDKPRFTGLETADLVARTEAGFQTAIEKAVRLLAARRHCQSIIDSPNLPSPAKVLPPWDKTRYVELFLDEGDWTHAGGTHFSVGGCFAVFDAPTLKDARKKADAFDDALVQRGIRYFQSRGVGVEPPDKVLLRKGTNIAPRLVDWSTEASAPVCLGALRMRHEKGARGTRDGSLANTKIADNRYFLALKSLLELFFCETVPALAGDGHPGEVIVSVFPATRAVSVDLAHQNTAMTNYGLKETRKKGLFFSLDRSFVYPLVDDILDSHGIKRRTARLLAPQLPYHYSAHSTVPEFFICTQCNKTVEAKGNVSADELQRDLRCACKPPAFRPDYRALHYLADEMLSVFPDNQKRRIYDALFADLIPGEFDELWDAELATTLTAGRCLDAGDLVGAIAAYALPSSIGRKPRAGVWLQNRLAAKMDFMTGTEFIRVANLISDVPRKDKKR